MPDKPAPYTFVPIVTNSPLYEIIYHSGTANLLSGELLCEIEALTPLHVGHFQYKFKHSKNKQALQEKFGCIFPEDKGILEPLFLNTSTIKNSPVVIPGSSIKGMVRHNIGAMLGAPMERVQEQYFSYRPNLAWNNNPDVYQCREAVITSVTKDGKGQLTSLTIDILPAGRNAYFISKVTKRSYENTFDSLTWGDKFNAGGITYNNKRISNNNQGDDLPGEDYKFLRYRAGIDGNGQVATTFDNRVKDDIAVIVPVAAIDEATKDVIINGVLLKQYQETKDELVNETYGHASRKKDIQQYLGDIKNDNLEENQLIYVEVDMYKNDKVVSFGQNFRYRWRYADSILKVQDGNTGKRKLREEVHNPEEKVDGTADSRLTAARLLFGYVDGGDESLDQNSQNLYMTEDSKSDYSRLAGRITINSAVERGDLSDIDNRFVQSKKTAAASSGTLERFTLPLKILGQPRASAVEHYLQQPDNKLRTYGDLPGVEPSGAKLSGRKFYRHQPVEDSNTSFFEETDKKNIGSNQSILAKYISKPGIKFRFKVRFKELREWELGALMLALNPTLKRKGTANKLGHGRPLGLGSVQISLDKMKLLNNQGNFEIQEKHNNNFEKYIVALENEHHDYKSQINSWLDVLKYEGCVIAEYPNTENNIYSHHTKIRAKYSIQRRDGAPMLKNYGAPVNSK